MVWRDRGDREEGVREKMDGARKRDGPGRLVAEFNIEVTDAHPYEAIGLVRPHPRTVQVQVVIGPSSVEVRVGGLTAVVEHRRAMVRAFIIDAEGQTWGVVEVPAARVALEEVGEGLEELARGDEPEGRVM